MRGRPIFLSCATLRWLTGREQSASKSVSLALQQDTLSRAPLWGKKWMWCRFTVVFRGLAACLPPQVSYHLDKITLQKSNISEVLSAFEKLSHSSTAVIRGIKSANDVLVKYEFKLKKKTRSGFTCKLGKSSSSTSTVRKRPVANLKIYSFKVYSHERCKKAQRSVFTEMYHIPCLYVLCY